MTKLTAEQNAFEAMELGNFREAAQLLRPLADEGNEYALLSLGWIYETGAIDAPDKDSAYDFYQRAADQGSAPAFFYLGKLLLANGDRVKAKAAFEEGTKRGNDECKSKLKKLNYSVSEEIAFSAMEAGKFEEAARLLRPLAEQENEYGLISLGWMHETGAIGDVDVSMARTFYQRAASRGSANACFELGRLLSNNGEEVQARETFQVGAERGDVACMSRFGRMMVEGRGGPVDLDGGTTWLKKAAASGHIYAQRTLLGIEERDARTILEKLSVKRKIAALVKKGAGEILKDPYSDKVR